MFYAKNSERGSTLSQSPIRSLLPFAQQAKASGKHVYHLNIGQPDIPTPPAALEVVRNINESIVEYGASEGLFSLREKVANYYDKYHAGLSPQDVFVTTGASEAILFAILCTCDPGDEIIIPEPFYANYLGFAHMASIHIIPLTTSIQDNFELPEVEQFEALITPRTKAIFLCNPGNPTGQLYSKSDLEKLMVLVKRNDLFLYVDEVYREFCYDKEFTSVFSFQGMEENLIVIDSISKVFSACGARVGYLITKNKSVQKTVEKYAQLRLCPPYFGQRLAEACYDYADEYIQPVKKEYIRRRSVLYNGLKEIEGLQLYKPEAAFYNMVGLPIDDATHFCKWLLTDFSINNSTVMLAPGNGFYFDKNLGKNEVRIAYVLNENDLKKAVVCLKEALGEYAAIMKKIEPAFI
ncbi:MAG: pyridoxal phosphate-dependent aminotransferase [Saprospiraceae bacterium]